MRAFRTIGCIAVLACGYPVMAGEGTVRFASAQMRQPIVETPMSEEPEEPELLPPSDDAENRGEAEDVPDEQVKPGTQSGTTQNPFDYGTMYGSGLPASPYKAGLSYMMTPQPFRVPYTNRFYYPCPHFVRRCPYFPKGLYWGANWNRVFLPSNNLVHGAFRFNPYLSRLNAQKQGTYGHHHHHCPPVVVRSVSTDRSGTVEYVDEASTADVPTIAGRIAPDNLRPQRE